MKVLITGGSGLIGGYLCKVLLEEGHFPTVYELSFGTLDEHGFVNQAGWILGDILNWFELKDAIAEHDVVFHLAAQSGVPQSKDNPMACWELNIKGTYNVLEACRFNPNIKAVVVASSNHIYGNGMAVAENGPMLSLDPYSVSKICADYLARCYAKTYDLPIAVVRNTNCFGPIDPHRDHIIGGTIFSILRGEVPTIWTDGSSKKAYLHAYDVAQAYYLTAKLLLAKPDLKGHAFNVSTESISVLNLVKKIMKLMPEADGMKPIILGQPYDLANEQLVSTKFRRLTGWKPTYSLDQALKETIDYMREREKVAA